MVDSVEAGWLRRGPAGEAPLALITLLALTALHVVRGYGVGSHELALDEASTYHAARHTLEQVVRLAVESHSQPPLFYLLVHATLPFGDSEPVLRGLSWVCFLALVWVVVLGVRELSLFARGLFGFVLVTSDYAYSLLIVRPYAMCALTSFLASLLLLRAVEMPHRPAKLVGYVLAMGAAVATAAFNAWLFVAHGLVLAAVFLSILRHEGLRPALRRLGWLLAGLALLAACYLPYVLHASKYAQLHGTPSVLRSLAAIWSPHTYARYVTSLSRVNGWPAYLLLLPMALGVWRMRGPARLLWPLIAFGQPMFVVAFMAERGSPLPRYVSPAFPALLLLGVAGIEQLTLWLLRDVRFRAKLAFVPLVLSCIATALAAKELRHPNAAEDAGNWQRLSQKLREVPGKKVVFFRVGINAQMPAYYSRRDSDVEYLVRSPLGDNRPNRAMATPGLISRGIESRPDTRCFVFVKDKRRGKSGADLYDNPFSREMARRGYSESFTVKSGKVRNQDHDYYEAIGFCRG